MQGLSTEDINDITMDAIKNGYKEMHGVHGIYPPYGIPVHTITRAGERIQGTTAFLTKVGPLDLCTVVVIYNYETIDSFDILTLDHIILWKEVKI